MTEPGLAEKRAARHQRDKEKNYARTAAWKKANPDYMRGVHLRRKYGITIEEYDAMLTAQDNKCALCPAEHSDEKRLAVDHDHATGKVRALLCVTCNNHLGIFERRREQFAQYVCKHG